MRERLPDTRKSINHKLVLHHTKPGGKIERLHVYLVIGMYGDGRPAELFITVNKGNDTISGFCKVFAILVSLCLQSGVTIEKLFEKLSKQAFEPSGFTENKDIHSCSSIVDYVMSLFKQQFMSEETIEVCDNNIASEELAHDVHLSKPISDE